ncbi:MAG: hypothetical protein HZA90_04125 [Verrucomicrobia bacterium]|nr:hypothetical protein [Verrucomicrobiota bacterium]
MRKLGYRGGKWGIYLRAPDLYFEIVAKYGDALVPFGQMAQVRYAVKSGCDPFFFPLDITGTALKEESDPEAFRRRYRCLRAEAAKGKVRVVRAGDGSEHPIEAKFLGTVFVPEDDIKNILLAPEQNRQRILWLNKAKSELKGTHVLDYLKYGQRENFGEGEVVPDKPTCQARPNHWYDLTASEGTRLLMPKGQQYGNIVFYAPEPFLCNSRVYNLTAPVPILEKAFAAILNSTLAALWRCLYGRALGREGAADIMVVDVKMMPVPDPRRASPKLVKQLEDALDAMGGRQIQPFLETAFAQCDSSKRAKAMENDPVRLPPELESPDRQQLDEAVLELIGVQSTVQRRKLRQRLYEEVALFYRQVRILELQAMENRRRAKKGKVASVRDVAAEILESIEPAQLRHFPADFLPAGEPLENVELPEGKAVLYDPHDFYDAKSLSVGQQKLTFRHRAQAELAKLHCDLDRRGFVRLPVSEESCAKMINAWQAYLATMRETLEPLSRERTEDVERMEAILVELVRLLGAA